MLISFSGYQSTGKTTAVYRLAHLLKTKGINVNTWVDIPRRCPLPINETGNTDTQWWILSKMIQETLELMLKHPVIITDRTPVDCAVYELTNHEILTGIHEWTPIATTLYQIAVQFLKSRPHKIYWVSQGYGWKSDESRSGHNEFKILSHFWFKEILSRLLGEGLNITEVDLCGSDTIDKIAEEHTK